MRAALLIILLFFASIFSILTDGYCQNLGFRFKENIRKKTIPIEIYNNLVIIPVILNGKIPLKFILDSGVSSPILFNKAITDVLNINYTRKISVFGVGEESVVQAFVASDIQLDIPGIVGQNQSILALEEDYLELRKQLGVEVHGIIGYDLFSRFVIEIDYSEKKIVLYDPNFYKPKKRWEVLEMKLYLTKPFVKIPFSIDGKTEINGNFIIDTGASHAMLINKLSDDRIVIPDKNINAVLGKGLTGIVRGELARINSAQVGSVNFENIIVSFPDEETYSDSLIYFKKNGTIGGELLSRFKIVFDYIHEKVYLKTTLSTYDEFEYNMSGLDLEASGPAFSDIIVTSIRKGSPANNAGVEVNDRIIALNGLSGNQLELSSIYKIFNSHEGKKIRIILRRGNRRLKKIFFLKKEI